MRAMAASMTTLRDFLDTRFITGNQKMHEIFNHSLCKIYVHAYSVL